MAILGNRITPSSSIKSADSNDSNEDKGIDVNDENERDNYNDTISDRNQVQTITNIKTETFWENLNNHVKRSNPLPRMESMN